MNCECGCGRIADSVAPESSIVAGANYSLECWKISTLERVPEGRLVPMVERIVENRKR